MERRKQSQKYQLKFEHITTPKVKVKKWGNSLVLRIPSKLVKLHEIVEGMEFYYTMHIQKKEYFGELNFGEEWVKMTKKERIQFSQWKKEKDQFLRNSGGE